MNFRAARICLVVGLILGAPAAAWCQNEAGASKRDRLSRDQDQVKRVITDLRGEMQRLVEKLRGPDVDPGTEAERLEAASRALSAAKVEDVLGQVLSSIEGDNLLDAVLKQDQAIESIDQIIQLLEEQRFDEQATDEKLKEIRDAREKAEALANKQRHLLERTKKALTEREVQKALEEVFNDIERLESQQQDALNGKSSDSIDSTGQQDQKALSEALKNAEKLAEAQNKWNGKTASLEPEKIPLTEAAELLDQLETALRHAETLAAKATDAQKAQSPQTKQSAEKSDSKGNASKSESSPEGSQSENLSEASSSDSSDSSRSGESQSESSKAEPRKSGTTQSEKPESDASRNTNEATAAEMEKLAGELQAALGDLQQRSQTSEAVPEESQRSIVQAQSESKPIADAARQGDTKKVAERSEKAAQALREAREAMAKQLVKMREQNALQTAGLTQQEGLLSEQSRQQAGQLKEASKAGKSDVSRKAFDQASGRMQKAAVRMRQAASALESGDRKAAQQAGERAAEELAEARKALQQGQQNVAKRSPEEKASDLQERLGDRAQELQKKVEDLLQRKSRKEKESEKLAKAGESLSKAGDAMKSAAKAGGKQQASLMRKKQQEALEQLQKAKEAVQQEKHERLDRLTRNKLKKETEQQKQLAQETGNAAQELSQSEDAEAQSQSGKFEKASQRMSQAGERLEQEQIDSAAEEQQKALDELEQATNQLQRKEDELARLRREQQLTNMIVQLTKLKDGEEEIFRATVEIHEGRSKGREGRRKRLRLRKKLEGLATQQGDLGTTAGELTTKLEEQASHVFSFVLENVGIDMKQVEDSLRELDTSEYTQFLEQEISRDLERLIAALKEQKKDSSQKSQQQGNQSQPSGEQRLVSMTAELLMLRDLQTNVNRKTRELEDFRKASDEPSASWDKALERLSQKQGSVSRMLGSVIEEFQKAAATGGGPQGGSGAGGAEKEGGASGEKEGSEENPVEKLEPEDEK